jgi:hypothetical protein
MADSTRQAIMPESIREQIIKCVYEHAAELTTKEVRRCLRTEPASKELFVSVWDGASNLVGREYGIETKSFSIGIELAWISGFETESQEANEVMARAEYHMQKVNLKGLAMRFDWSSSTPNYKDAGERVTTVRITYDIQFSTPIGNPYSLPKEE